MKTRLLALAAVLLVVTALPAQQAQPEITFTSTELAPGLFVVEAVGGFGGGNIGLLTGEDGVALIDDSYPPFTTQILAAVAEVTSSPIDFVINTHLHGDHSGGNQILGEAGATIVAHDHVRERLETQGMPVGGGETREVPTSALPVLTFADSVTVHLNGYEAHVRHLPNAHTDGDAAIHFREANVIHCGDLLFHQVFPYIDIDNGGGVDGYIAAQEALIEMGDAETKYIAGHGPLASRADLEASVAMLKDARSKIQALIDAGKTADEAVEADPLAAYADLSWGFIPTERMVRQVYRSLSE